MMKSAANFTLAWNPGTDQVALVPWPGRVPEQYMCTAFACFVDFRSLSDEERAARVFIDAYHLIVADGCDAAAVHRALYPLLEYRAGLADDFPKPDAPLRWAGIRWPT